MYIFFAFIYKPESKDVVDYQWISNLTDTSATIKIIGNRNTPNTTLELSVNEGDYKKYNFTNSVLTIHFTDLQQDTYHNLSYIEKGGKSRSLTFKTPGKNFTFVAASCQKR